MKWIFVDDDENPQDPEEYLEEAIQDLEILLEALKEKMGKNN